MASRWRVSFYERRIHRASLHRKVGKTWETQHQHETALYAYDDAEATSGP